MTHQGPDPGRDPAGDPAGDPQESRLERVEEAVEQAAETFVEGFEGTVDRALPPHLRLRAWARRRRATHMVWRAAVLAIGLALVVAGLLMLVFPGPGWAAIILGLVVLASEYAWANRLLEPVRRWARAAAAAALNPRVRRRNLLLLAGAVALVAAGLTWYVLTYGFTLQGVDALWPG